MRESTATSAKWAPKACRAYGDSWAVSSPVSAVTVRPSGGSGPVCSASRRTRAVAALCTAEPQEAVPEEPPATDAVGRSLLPTSTWTFSGSVPRTEAAICARTVRAPVPMSVALTRTRYEPSGAACAEAADLETRTGYVAEATPVPSSQGPSSRAAGRGSRSFQPKRAAPCVRQAARLRLLKGRPLSGSACGSLRSLSSTGSIPRAQASSSMADSSAYMPEASPGARIQDGLGTSSAATRCSVRLWGEAYMTRAGTAACSTNSLIREVWVTISWETLDRTPSRSAPRRTRCRVGAR